MDEKSHESKSFDTNKAPVYSLSQDLIARIQLYDQSGRLNIDEEFNSTAETLFKRLFENKNIFDDLWKSIKFYDFIVNEWEVDSNGFRKRTLEYKSDLGGILGSKVCNTYEEQKILEYDPTKRIIVEIESYNKGVPYSDAFTIRSIFIITFIGTNKCKLQQKALVFYIDKPNFIIRAFIEKHSYEAITDNLVKLRAWLLNEIKRIQDK